MNKFFGILSACLLAGTAHAAPVTPYSVFTAHDHGDNGFGVDATEPHHIAIRYDYVQSNRAAPLLLRGSVAAGTTERRSFAFLDFHLTGIASVSNATLSFENQLDIYVNDGAAFPPATPNVQVKAVARPNNSTMPFLDAAAYGTGATQTFTTLSPAGSDYTLDVTTILNSALSTRSGSDLVSLILSIDEPFSSLPNVANGGYGNVIFQGFELDAVAGPAPAITPAVPLPAGLPLMFGGLTAFGLLRRAGKRA